MNKMRAIHPGEILRGELEAIKLSANQLAHCLGVPSNRITSILHGQRAITADTAIRLSCYFGTTAEFWLNLQMMYDLKSVSKIKGDKIKREIRSRKAA